LNLFSKIFSKNEPKLAVQEKTPLSLEIGDIVTYNMKDFEVTGKITYRDGRHQLFHYLLFDDSEGKILTASMDEEMKLGIFQRVLPAHHQSFPSHIKYENVMFYKAREASARMLGYGSYSRLHGILAKVAEYRDAAGKSLLQLEAWGTEQKMMIGYPIEPFELKIIAGKK
jgi:hypothetical protein